MSQAPGFDFTQFAPGFDFFKNLTPGGAAAVPLGLPGWAAPTLDPQELAKRIQELKTVQFWLDQNTKAIAATIQALEVQHMTLNALKGMNVRFNDVAESLKAHTGVHAKMHQPAQGMAEAAPPAAEPRKPEAVAPVDTAAGTGVNPAQWWGALTEQFQHIAAHTMKDMAHRAAAHTAEPASATDGTKRAQSARPAPRSAKTGPKVAPKKAPKVRPQAGPKPFAKTPPNTAAAKTPAAKKPERSSLASLRGATLKPPR